ncbi:MAG: nuclear transport factor 2 family protein [Pseudomonadota bacterium]
MDSNDPQDTRRVIDRFNEAFQRHDPALLDALVAEDCVLENTVAAPDGDRHVGRAACLAVWHGIAGNREGAFELEDTRVFGEEALIFWRYRWGPGQADSVRGINVMRVRGGQIVEGRGYVKAAGAAGDAQ